MGDPMETNNTTTKKHNTFISTPLTAVTSLTMVPGVGTVTLQRLAKAGILHPQQLVGHFMVLNRDATAMISWLKQSGVRQREADTIVNALVVKCERIGVM